MGHIIAVYSGSGGSGCTTLAVNLAIGLMQQKARVLLIDLSLPYGDVGVFLNLRSTTSLFDALGDDLDIDLLDSLITRHESSLAVLPAPSTIAAAQQITSDGVKRLLMLAAGYYDLIVIDLNHHMDEVTLAVFDASSVITLVLLPTLTSVKNAKLTLDFFNQLGYLPQNIVPVLNRVSDQVVKQRLAINESAIEKHLRVSLEVLLPLDETAAVGALMKGTTLVQHGLEMQPLSKAFMDLSDYVFRMLVYDADETPDLPDELKVSPVPVSHKPVLPASPSRRDNTSGEKITILIADAEAETAKMIQKLLVFEPDFEVVGMTTNGAEVVEMATRLKPHVVLLALNLTDMDSIEAASQIVKALPSTAIIMMSVANSPDDMRRAMLAGARDFLTKPIDMDELYRTVRLVHTHYEAVRKQYNQKPFETSSERRTSAASARGSALNLRPAPDKVAARSPQLIEPEPVQYRFRMGTPGKPISPFRPSPAKTTVRSSQPDEHQANTPSPAALARVQFTAYHPREARIQHKHGLYVYAHLEEALASIQQDVEKFKDELGGNIPQPRSAKQFAQMAEGTPITIVPESDVLQFEPESLTKRWRGPFTRFEFDFFPDAELDGEMAFVRVSVQVAGVEVAFIKCGIEVSADAPNETAAVLPEPDTNPLAMARLTSQRAETYSKIFISYSRQDTAVARAYQLAQLAMGNEVFIDVDSLRAGENWQAALARAIDTADIFQLFWSPSYAQSEFCRYEWDYALRYRCPDDQCEGFIRPVYWVSPMPASPPVELSHLNFKYVPFNDET